MLTKHSDIQDAAVVGVPDDVMGELPRAYVVKTPDAQITEADVVQYVAGRYTTTLFGNNIRVNGLYLLNLTHVMQHRGEETLP